MEQNLKHVSISEEHVFFLLFYNIRYKFNMKEISTFESPIKTTLDKKKL